MPARIQVFLAMTTEVVQVAVGVGVGVEVEMEAMELLLVPLVVEVGLAVRLKLPTLSVSLVAVDMAAVEPKMEFLVPQEVTKQSWDQQVLKMVRR